MRFLFLIALLVLPWMAQGQIDPRYRKNVLTTNDLVLGTNLFLTNGVLESVDSGAGVTFPLSVANGGTGDDLSNGVGGAIPYYDASLGKFVTTPPIYTNGILFEPTLGFLSVFHTNYTGELLLNLGEGGSAGPSIQGFSDRFVVANTNLTLQAAGPFTIQWRIDGSNVLQSAAGGVSLSSTTNILADNGTSLTYNGSPLTSAFAGTVLNSVASAGLLAVDSTKTNGIAATLAHMTNALAFTGSISTFLRSDGTQAIPGDTLWASSGGVLQPSPAVNLLRVASAMSNNATNVALVVDTASAWTNKARLLQLNNNGVEQLAIKGQGQMWAGRDIANSWGPDSNDALAIWHDTALGEPSSVNVTFGVVTNADINNGSYAQFSIGRPNNTARQASLDLFTTTTSGVNRNASLNVTDSQLNLIFTSGSTNLMWLLPTTTDVTETSYLFNTDRTHTSGDLLKLQNNGTNKFTVAYNGAIATGSTNTMRNGNIITGVTVALTTTNYWEVTINGVVKKVALVQ